MPSFDELLKEKNKRLNDIPEQFLTVVEKQQKTILNDIIEQLSSLTTVDGKIKINSENIKQINIISDELKSIFLNDEYLHAVKEFSNEFEVQARLNDKIIKAGFGDVADSPASKLYTETARKNAVAALVSENNFTTPIQKILENSVVNGASVSDTVAAISLFVEGDENDGSKLLRYSKQIASDSFAIADRSYTSIIADNLDSEWFYYSGGEVASTRCFCDARVGHYFYYKEIESWGNGENLGACDQGDGTWAGEIQGTNSATIFSYLGGYNCLHSLMPVSDSIVPEEDRQRAIDLGFINN